MSAITIKALLLSLAGLGMWSPRMCVGRASAIAAHSTQHEALPSTALPSAPYAWDASTAQREPAQRAPVLSTPVDADDAHLWPQLPSVTTNAVVTRPATAAEARAAYAAILSAEEPWSSPDVLGVASGWDGGASRQAARALLHGRRHRSSYHKCPRCTIIRCMTDPFTKRTICTGHCKSSQRLFLCKSVGTVAGICDTPPEERPDPRTLAPDTLDALESAVVTAPAPFIGCANITGAPADGCPPRGASGNSPALGPVTVLFSSCVQHLYTLPCAEDEDDDYSGRTPFFPFGYCQCVLLFGDGGVGVEPCMLPDFEEGGLDKLGSGEGGAVLRNPTDTPVRVYVDDERNVTVSEFGVREETDPGTYRLQHVFDTSSGNISVELQLYRSFPSLGVNLTAEGPLGAEEHGGSVGRGAAAAEGPAVFDDMEVPVAAARAADNMLAPEAAMEPDAMR